MQSKIFFSETVHLIVTITSSVIPSGSFMAGPQQCVRHNIKTDFQLNETTSQCFCFHDLELMLMRVDFVFTSEKQDFRMYAFRPISIFIWEVTDSLHPQIEFLRGHCKSTELSHNRALKQVFFQHDKKRALMIKTKSLSEQSQNVNDVCFTKK